MTEKKPLTIEFMREKMASALPEILDHALTSYWDFATVMPQAPAWAKKAGDPPPEQDREAVIKGFVSYQSAGKNAAMHIQALLRLAQWALPAAQGRDKAELERLIKAARHEADGEEE